LSSLKASIIKKHLFVLASNFIASNQFLCFHKTLINFGEF
jgi:hypothetical protein